jgi:hypothetical protein
LALARQAFARTFPVPLGHALNIPKLKARNTGEMGAPARARYNGEKERKKFNFDNLYFNMNMWRAQHAAQSLFEPQRAWRHPAAQAPPARKSCISPLG